LTDIVFPGEKLTLTVYDPRYLVLIDRLGSSKGAKFGLAWNPNPALESPSTVGTVVKILKSQDIPDGKRLEVLAEKKISY